MRNQFKMIHFEQRTGRVAGPSLWPFHQAPCRRFLALSAGHLLYGGSELAPFTYTAVSGTQPPSLLFSRIRVRSPTVR